MDGVSLATLGLDGATEVAQGDERLPLAQWLRERRELTVLTRPFVAAHAERGDHASLRALLQPPSAAEFARLLKNRQLIDLLRAYPSAWDAESLVSALRPLAPRMYSIASSQEQADEEVHITVAHVDFEQDGEARWGAGSHYLCHAAEGDRVPVFIEANERFRLPKDSARDVIMIGPGTGIAPFRAFLQQRQAEDASGRNWLFFGNPHRRSDFLYQTEWLQALKEGALTRLDVAFSRDQAEKVYVQHRLREYGAQVWKWLSKGAHLYVCGDADRMAPDVHATLIEIAAEHGHKSHEEAAAWFKDLLTEGRYARDVY
ncbi:Sulfite reductase [NADPH] flavoprotein alpha-component OS=Castellaniella defragrans OX=75697 GN=HNR28_002919 PE=4 SV=1 [Castellaniella defragrans]